LGKSVEGFPEGQVASGLEAKIPRENIFCWGFLFFGFQIKVLDICINRLSQRLALGQPFLFITPARRVGANESRHKQRKP